MEVVRINGLSFSYNDDFSIEGVTISVNKGEVVSLLGPNGSGKTTLIKCVNALLMPNKGEIIVAGVDVKKYSRTDLARIIGYVPQSHEPSFPFTVHDVVLMGRVAHLDIFQQPSNSDYAKVAVAIQTVGLERLKDKPYTQISGGERQLTLIARALAQEPQVLILDEPTAHLDFKNQIQTLQIIRRLSRGRDIAVMLSLHDPNHALLFTDKTALLNSGRVVAFDVPDKVVNRENIARIYGIDVDVVSHGGHALIMPALAAKACPT
jgi:iron complex transport system ATP-binding protein